MLEVRLDRHAQRALDGLPSAVQARLVERMRELKRDPVRPRAGADVKRLHGSPGVFRLRVGDYRVFFVLYRKESVVVVTDIRHHSHAYD